MVIGRLTTLPHVSATYQLGIRYTDKVARYSVLDGSLVTGIPTSAWGPGLLLPRGGRYPFVAVRPPVVRTIKLLVFLPFKGKGNMAHDDK